MVERTTQNSRTRTSVLNVGSAGEKTLAEQLAQLIENIKLVPNTTTRITPFETHCGRKPNTKLTNTLTQPIQASLQ